MLSASRTFKVVKELFNKGVVGKPFVQKYVERMTPVLSTIHSKTVRNADDSEYWDCIRDLFAYDDYTDCTSINAANFCPSFDSVQQTVNGFQLELNLDLSIQKRVNVLSLIIDNARETIAQQLGVGSHTVALVRNTTEANNAINNGLALSPTDEVVIWEQNHGTNRKAWYIRQEERPFVIHQIPSDLDGATTNEEVVQSFVDRLTSNTKVVTFSHLSNESGVLLPAKDICTAVHDYDPNIHVHVDGAMTWGSMAHNLVDVGCDSYSASAHKWFVGPKEAGILYMKLSRVHNFTPNIFGYDGKIVLPDELYPDARRFETLGQRSDPTLMGLLDTADLLGQIGYDAIQARVAYLGGRVYAGFHNLGFPITTPADPARRHGVIIAGIDPDVGEDIYNYLYTEHQFGVASTGGLRVSATICNTEAQIDRLMAAIEEYGTGN